MTPKKDEFLCFAGLYSFTLLFILQHMIETHDNISLFNIFPYLDTYLRIFWGYFDPFKVYLKCISHTQLDKHTFTLSNILRLLFFFSGIILCDAALNSFTDGLFLFFQYLRIIIIAIR